MRRHVCQCGPRRTGRAHAFRCSRMLDECTKGTHWPDSLRWICLPGGPIPVQSRRTGRRAISSCAAVALGVFDGPTHLIHQIAADDCLGDMSLLSGEPHRFSARALRDSRAAAVGPCEVFEGLIEQSSTARCSDVARLAVERLLRLRTRHSRFTGQTPHICHPAGRFNGVPVRAPGDAVGQGA